MIVGSSLSCLAASVTQPSPKLSQASVVTGLAPSMVHIAISKAPVSDPGTMPMRCVQGQHFAHQVDAVLQPRLADLGAVRAAQRFGGEFLGGISGRLGAGTGREE